LQEETAALSDDLAVMVKENQAVTSQLGDALQRADECRRDGDAAHASVSILQQTVKARDLEIADFRAAYEGLVAEARASEGTIAHLKRQLGGCSTELEGAKAEISHLRDAAHSTQLQLQQYVVDVQAMERNSDVLTRELQSSKAESEDLARDRNRVLEQSQAVQVSSCSSATAHG
jgi:chromosome segregation ATPase